MSYELEPVAGQWYRQIDKDQLFRVVSIDEDDDLIAIQYFDGEAEELDSETWFTMNLDLTETPEDWIDPSDDRDVEDVDEAETSEVVGRTKRKVGKKPSDDWEEDGDEDEVDDWDDDSDDGYGSDE